MLTKTNEVVLSPSFSISDFTYQHQTIFFDIETTGLSASVSQIYLIGCGFFQDGSWQIRQWFAKDIAEEKKILKEFLKFIRPYFIGITYHGLGFDLPFLKKRCQFHQLYCPIDRLQMIDIYKKISPYRQIFHLPSLKQKDIEVFLDVPRTDSCSGKKLISLYQSYLASKEDAVLARLLTHNFEDIKNMILILPILSYEKIFRGQWIFSDFYIDTYQDLKGEIKEEAILTLKLLTPLPKRLSHSFGEFYFQGEGDNLKLRIPVYDGELKYFISDYKNYYYLPGEDTAIHKSVAFYVDKNFRTQARAATCYSKKNGRFLPQKKQIITPYFKLNYKDKTTYFECTGKILQNESLIRKYISHILTCL